MVRAWKIAAGVLVGVLGAGFAYAQSPMIQVAGVSERRSTGGLLNGVEVELATLGGTVDEVKSQRVRIVSATDDLGTNLLDPEKNPYEFDEIGRIAHFQQKTRLHLKSSPRKAMMIKEVHGSVELYSPSKDPNSMIVVPHIFEHTKLPLDAAALKSAGIQLVVTRAAEEEEMRKNAAAVVGAMKGLGAFMFGDKESTIYYHITDPQSRLVGFELLSADGKTIDRSMWSSSGKEVTQITYKGAPPVDAQLRIYVTTPLSIQKLDLNLENIPLP